ncbi:MAG TPA: hypothetical protein VHQ90_18765 [Thermoanaerobaculia bacterium]|nr:hypothetical protein [Thermoanaerobaculia bacterium]
MMEHRKEQRTGRGRRVSRPLYFASACVALGCAWGAWPADATSSWTAIGPEGGRVAALVADPVDPQVVYAVTGSAGVFKSSDGGASWRQASRGLTDSELVALAVDQVVPGTLYAASSFGVFVSRDGAATWMPAEPFSLWQDEFPQSLASDPARAGTVYAATFDGVWVSNDAGASWTQTLGLGGVIRLVSDPARSSVFALSGRLGSLRLFESADGGATWKDRSASLPKLTYGDLTFGFAVEPAAPGILYIALTHVDFDSGTKVLQTLRSSDGAASWQAAGTGSEPVAASAGGLVVAGGFKSSDHGASWQPVGELPDAVAAYAIAAGGSKVYAGGATRGVLASADGARSWQVMSKGLTATSVLALAVDPFASDPHSPAWLYAAVENLGLLRSRNGGSRWRPLDTGLEAPTRNDFYALAAHPAAPGNLYYFSHAVLESSTDAGASWTQLGKPHCVTIDALSPDPSAPAVLYAAGSLNCGQGCGGAFKSTDRAASWSCLGVAAYQIAVAPSAPATLYALAPSPPSGNFLYRSTDSGRTWVPLEVPRRLARGAAARYGHLAVAVDPWNAARLYVGGPTGVWMSQDGGESWSRKDHGLPHGVAAPLLAIDPHQPLTLYAAAAEVGVFRSRDGGDSWQPIRDGLPDASDVYTTLAVDPGHPGSLYLAIAGSGIYSFSSP